MLNPFEADAMSSGGRSGGSSFRSAPSRSMPSSTRLGGSTRSYGSTSYAPRPMIVPMPMYSPFGYGGGFGFSPFGFMPINLNLLIIGGVAYAVYSVLKNRVGGADFNSGEEAGSLGGGASVLKLQVCLDSNWDYNNIQDTLALLAAKNGAMSSRSDIAKLLSEASIALLRRQEDWTAAAYEGEKDFPLNVFIWLDTYHYVTTQGRSSAERERPSHFTRN